MSYKPAIGTPRLKTISKYFFLHDCHTFHQWNTWNRNLQECILFCSLLSAIAMFLYRRKIRRNGSKARAGMIDNGGIIHVMIIWPWIERNFWLHILFFFFSADNGIRNGRSYITSTDKTWPDIVYEIMVCLGKLGLIMAYTFLCDR